MSTPPLLAYYGDDFTGSTDALEFLTRAGVRTVLFTSCPTASQLAHYPDLRAVGVAGFTRALPPAEMERELRPAFSALRALGAAHVHYKVCSTFDSSPTVGSIGRAIEIGSEIFRSRFVPLVIGAPPLGRYCVFGNLFARYGIGSAGSIHRLDRHPAMSTHPVTPADESDLRLHLARQTKKRSALLDVLALARPETERRAALEALIEGGAEIVLFDVFETEHLGRIGSLLAPYASAEKPLFSVGSSAVEMALGSVWTREGAVQWRSEWPTIEEARPLLVISGSCSPVTVGQIKWARAHGFAEVSLDAAAGVAQCEAAVAAAVREIRARRHVIVHSNPPGLRDQTKEVGSAAGTVGAAVHGNTKRPSVEVVREGNRPTLSSPESAALGAGLGRVARDVVAATGVKRVLVAGGDTSSYAARAMGIRAVEMIAPLAPGAPLCRADAPGSPVDGIEINFKGGQVGAEDYFGAVAKGVV